MAAVVPRFPAAKQRSEVSVKVLKGPVHLLENRSIHFLPHLPKLSPTTPSSYHVNRRCNTRTLFCNVVGCGGTQDLQEG